MKYHILFKKIEQYLNEFEFYYNIMTNDNNEDNNKKNYQNGTFRINCIDCLDRTGRVQTFIGLEVIFF